MRPSSPPSPRSRSAGSSARISSAFVIARVNPIRFQRGGDPKFDETIAKMLASAQKFDAGKIKADQVAAASGPPED